VGRQRIAIANPNSILALGAEMVKVGGRLVCLARMLFLGQGCPEQTRALIPFQAELTYSAFFLLENPTTALN
jgi:hypothetical protein